MPDHLICLIRNLFAGQEAIVRTGHGTRNWVQIRKGASESENYQSALKNNFKLYFCLFSSRNIQILLYLVIVQFSSVTQSCPTLCDPMNRGTPGLPVHHLLLEYTHTHVHWVGDAIQPSHARSSPSSSAPNPSQHQSLFQWVNSSHEVAKLLEFQLQHHSLQRNPRADLLVQS